MPGADESAFLASSGSWPILAGLICSAISGGVFIAPLYDILQVDTDPAERLRAIAVNNIANAIVTVLTVVVVTLLGALGGGAPGIIGALRFATLKVGDDCVKASGIDRAITRIKLEKRLSPLRRHSKFLPLDGALASACLRR